MLVECFDDVWQIWSAENVWGRKNRNIQGAAESHRAHNKSLNVTQNNESSLNTQPVFRPVTSSRNTLLVSTSLGGNEERNEAEREKQQNGEGWRSRVICARVIQSFCLVCFHGFTSVPHPVEMSSEDIFWEQNEVRWSPKRPDVHWWFPPHQVSAPFCILSVYIWALKTLSQDAWGRRFKCTIKK